VRDFAVVCQSSGLSFKSNWRKSDDGMFIMALDEDEAGRDEM